MAMSRNTPPCGLPRPAFTSAWMARATMSRGSKIRRALGLRSSTPEVLSRSHWSASASVVAVSFAYSSGMYPNMMRLPSLLRSVPPSPRTPSVMSVPRTLAAATPCRSGETA